MDESISISNIPVNTNNRLEEAIHKDKSRRRKQVEAMCDEYEFTDEEEECSEPEHELEPERSGMSDDREASMQNAHNEELQRSVHSGSYSEHSSRRDSDSQHSLCECSDEQCEHSFHTEGHSNVHSHARNGQRHTDEEDPCSDVYSHVEDGQRSEVQNMNRHSPSDSLSHSSLSPEIRSEVGNMNSHLFLPSPNHSFQETSYANGDMHALNGSSISAEITKLQEQYRCLQVLYDSTLEELQIAKISEQKCRSDSGQQINILKQSIKNLNDAKEELGSRLQDVQTMFSECESENKNLLSQVCSLEGQLADIITERNNVVSKLESTELTVYSLEKQLRDLKRTTNLSREQEQHNRILEDFKLRHQKEVLQYKENIDELQDELAKKIQFADNLSKEKSDLQQKCEKLIREKSGLFTEIETMQEKLQQLLKKDSMEQLNLLELQVRRLQEENKNLNENNITLKDNIRSLKVELSNSEALLNLATSSKGNKNQDRSDKKQGEFDLKQELETSLINSRTLRTENCNLKKQLKDSENELAQMGEKIRYLELQMEESEKKSKHLEEKLQHLSECEPFSEPSQMRKIKSLEQELELLRIDSHDLTKKLKESTKNEKFLIERNEELQRKITELMHQHSEEKLKSVEACRKKYMEVHENVLSMEKGKLVTKAEQELKDVSSKYENKIANLQKQNTALSEKLLRTYQDNQNLQKKLNEMHKEREDAENKLRADYDEQLKQMKELLTKQKDEYIEKYLKVETERAQIEWANKKMADIKNYVETTKQKLDGEFQKCLQKERDNFSQELRIEKKNLIEQFNQKLQDLKRHHDKEKQEQGAQLTQDLESKWLIEIALLKEREKKAMKEQQELENKLALAERELKYLKDKASTNSKSQDEIEKIKQEYIQKQKLFDQEKAQLLSSETELNENVKLLVETEKRLRKKLLQYERHTAAIKKKHEEDTAAIKRNHEEDTTAIKKRHEEEITQLQIQLSDLQKAYQERQNQLQAVRLRSEQQMVELGEKFRKQCVSSGAQTEDEVLKIDMALDMEHKFFKCLENISEEFRRYIKLSNTRNAERLQSSLQAYHQQSYSRNLQDISNDLRSFTPTLIIPKMPTRSSSSIHSRDMFASTQDFQNSKFTSSQDCQNVKSSSPRDFHLGKFTTSTPGLFHASKNPQVQSEIGNNKNFNSGNRNSSPNFSVQTKPKTVSNFGQNSDIFKNYFTTIYKNCTPAMDLMGVGDSANISKKVAFVNGHSHQNGWNNGPDHGPDDGMGDISYDFIPTNQPASVCGPGKFTNGGLFGNGNF